MLSIYSRSIVYSLSENMSPFSYDLAKMHMGVTFFRINIQIQGYDDYEIKKIKVL